MDKPPADTPTRKSLRNQTGAGRHHGFLQYSFHVTEWLQNEKHFLTTRIQYYSIQKLNIYLLKPLISDLLRQIFEPGCRKQFCWKDKILTLKLEVSAFFTIILKDQIMLIFHVFYCICQVSTLRGKRYLMRSVDWLPILLWMDYTNWKVVSVLYILNLN